MGICSPMTPCMPAQWGMAMPDPSLDDDDGELPDIKMSDIKRGNRGDDSDGGSVDDMADATIDAIVECLNEHGPAGVARLRQYAAALTAMTDAYQDRDEDTFNEATGKAYKALRHLISN
jgi:hypothetical protein